MNDQFDEIIVRHGTNSLKYDFATERQKPADILPFWVADMDFQAPAAVRDALMKSAEHNIFGYTEVKAPYYNAVKNWFQNGFDFEIAEEWLVKTPGVVFAIAAALRAFSEKGDAILIQTPVYYPFSEVILDNDRTLIRNSLVYKDGTYHIDFDDFERKIADNNVKLFILCSPHNPVGRVWTKQELTRMGEICLRFNCIILSDEIHCDFVYPGYKHHVFGSLNTEFLNNTLICTAPSKTFNLAGLQVSNIFIANPELRLKFQLELKKTGYSQLNTMGLVACQAAYEHGAQWLKQLKVYLADNMNFVHEFLSKELPQIKLVVPQGTYLLWLDCTALGLTQNELDNLIVQRAKLWLDSGTMFGDEGTGFQRINIACPRQVLKAAMLQLKNIVH